MTHEADVEALRLFLNGEAPLDDTWFGESHPTLRGAFWWRTMMNNILKELARRQAEAQPVAWRYESVKALLRAYGMTTENAEKLLDDEDFQSWLVATPQVIHWKAGFDRAWQMPFGEAPTAQPVGEADEYCGYCKEAGHFPQPECRATPQVEAKQQGPEPVESANQSDPICGNCSHPKSTHYHEDRIYCFKRTNGDVFTDEPQDSVILDAFITQHGCLYDALVNQWKRANGHIPPTPDRQTRG